MIAPGDKVMVGVSGGKDSVALTIGLAELRKYIGFDFTVQAVTLDPQFGGRPMDYTVLQELFARYDIPYEIRRTEIGPVVFDYRKEKNPCALCAKLRRGALNSYAVAHGCNKVALGHNRDDVIQTFFMSLLYEGRMNTFAPVTYLSRRDVTVIRPLIFLPEKHALGIARARELPILPPNCDIAGHTKREEAKQLVQHLTGLVPDFEEKFMHALSTTETYGLWDRMRLKGDESHKR